MAVSGAVDVAVIISAGSSVLFGLGGYVTGLATRRRKVLDTVLTDQMNEAGRLAAEIVGERLSAEMTAQLKPVNDHLTRQDATSRRQGEDIAWIKGKLGLPDR